MAKHLIPEAALKKHIAILGMNGSGKTSVAKSQIIEPALAAGERVCNIDPTGVGWGLRLKTDGKNKGYPIYIVGGDRADFPLFRRDGKAWAEIVGTSSDSFVFDTSQMTVEDRSGWFTDFAETIIRKNKGPLKLVLDEAHLFAPQGGSKSGGIAPKMLHATNNLLALGRSRGLRITMISQRPAKLHKDSLTQAHTLIAMALMAPQDRAAVKDWIADQADVERGKEIIASLPGLNPGEGWIWAPKEKVLERVKFSRPKTFDSSSAPDDGDGAAIALSPVDPETIKAKLATVAKETVANDPVALKSANAALTREVQALKAAAGAAKPGPVDPAEKQKRADAAQEARRVSARAAALAKALEEAMKFIVTINASNFFVPGSEAVDAGAVTKAVEQATKNAMAEIKSKMSGRNKEIDALRGESQRILARLKKIAEADVTVQVDVRHNEPFTVSAKTPITPREPRVPVEGALERPLQKIVDSIRWWNVLGIAEPKQPQVSFVAGYSHKSGTWASYLSKLRTSGLIHGSGELSLTSEGAGLANEPGDVPSGEALRAAVVAKLDAPLVKILRPILESYPDALSQEDAGSKAGYSHTSGTWASYLSRLRTLELISGSKELKAQEWLFP